MTAIAPSAAGTAAPGDAPWPLTPRQREVLAAAVATIVPVASTPAGGQVDLVDTLARRLRRMPAHKRQDVLLAVGVLGSRLAALATTGLPVPFHKRGEAARAAFLERWGRSRIGHLRTVFQGIRRLILATYYGDARSHGGIGYAGPLHTGRRPFEWEGAAVGTARDDEPIARAAEGPRAPLPVPPPPRLRAARDVPARHDVIVIGTGAGGAVAAARLAEAGRSVLLLEEGPLVQSDAFDEREAALVERLYAEQGLRATDDLSVALFQGAAVGGSTTVNWMIMLRPPEHVLDEWRRRFGLDWCTPQVLGPVLDRIEREVHARPVPDDAHSPNNRLVLDGARALGWRARAGMVNARGCVRSGFCGTGCRYDAKQGTLLTFVPRAVAAGATLVSDARAERIERLEPGRDGLKRVTVVRRCPSTGETLTEEYEAPTVVVAGGAIGTPALLQRSGLGGRAVGRYLRLHPTTAVVGDYGDRTIYAAGGMPMTTVCDEFLHRDANGYGYWIQTPPLHPTLAAGALPGFGAEHRAVMERFPHLGILIALVRDGADLTASSGEVRVGDRGRIHLHYRLTRADAQHLREGMESCARLHLAQGAREVRTLHTRPVVARTERDLAAIRTRSVAPNDVAVFSAHVNGTCRMGTDPKTSGASPEGEVHGAPGIYVADGSLLPTGLGVNPQATIMAVATVVAEGIVGRRPSGV